MTPSQPSNTTISDLDPFYFPIETWYDEEEFDEDEEYIYDDEEDENESGDTKW